MAVLDIRGLMVSFKERGEGQRLVRAADGVDLKIEKGEFASLVGASGSGKSVTALSVCRLIRAHSISGEIFYATKRGDNIKLLSRPEKELAALRGSEIAYVFQDPASSMNPVLRAGAHLAETILAHAPDSVARARQKALQALASVRIPDPERVFSSFPHELSGGLKQRVMIAAALVLKPRLLIADEPTTALDSVTGAGILSLLNEIRTASGVSILFITHDLKLAAARSDTIHVMQKGRIVEVLTKKNKFSAGHAYSRALLGVSLEGLKPKTRIEVSC